MASRLLLRPLSPLAYRTTFTVTSACAASFLLLQPRPRLLLDTSPEPLIGSGNRGFADSARTQSPMRRFADEAKQRSGVQLDERGRVDGRVFQRVSLGSVLGLGTGLLLSAFSRPLTILLGLSVFALYLLESRAGIRLIPYERIGRLVKGVDVKGVLMNDAAFKISFAVTCLLAGWGSF